jgi:aldose 1-epimerase
MPLDLITLTDPITGAAARILPAVGFNCFSFQPLLDQEPVELLWSEESFSTGAGRSTRSGIPILFPFPGRLRGKTLRFGDREVPLVIDPKQGCAIHGFVHNRPWRVLESSPASVTGEFHAAIDDAKLLDLWPCDFRIRVCYELRAGALESTLTVDNPGDRPLPFGLGTHEYFRVPLAADPAGREECRVFAPARRYWELVNMFPTGKTPPADGSRALSTGMAYRETHLDDVFTDLQSTGGRVICHVDDPTNRRRMVLEFDDSFHECVAFNPPHREAICLEPYTCAPDAYALTEQGIDAGLRVLQPGETFQARVEIRLESLD